MNFEDSWPYDSDNNKAFRVRYGNDREDMFFSSEREAEIWISNQDAMGEEDEMTISEIRGKYDY